MNDVSNRSMTLNSPALIRAGLDRYAFIAALAALPFVKAVWLYGSRARGDHYPRSDIDLALEAPGATAAEWEQALGVVDVADTLLRVDCVRLDALPLNDPLRLNIQADGVWLARPATEHEHA
jgi:uncharacterized protein